MKTELLFLRMFMGKKRQMCFLILNKAHTTTYFTVECVLKIFPTSVLS